MISALIAVAVLVVAAILLFVFRHRGERDIAVSARAALITGAVSIRPDAEPDAAGAVVSAEAVGSAMIQAGFTVETVQDVLSDIAHVNGVPESDVLVFPNAVLMSARDGTRRETGAVAGADGQLLLSQIDEVQRTADAARTGVLDPHSTAERIRRIRLIEPAYGPVLRVVGYGFLSGALSVLLGASWLGVSLSVALGLVVGAGLLLSERVPRRYGALITVALAFLVAAVVLLLVRMGWGSGILAALLAPLVVLLPGALLTTAVLELSMGHMISGAGRAAAGGMQLILLGAGIVTAGAIVGVPDFDFSKQPDLLGPVAPWIAVAVFGVAICVHRSAPRKSIPWILFVLYVAYAAQVLGDLLVGGVLSAFVGALVVTPVTALVARQPSGPAALVSFTPAFALLVPGAIGLVSVADVLGGDSAGTASLVTTLATMVAIALGVLAGSSLSNRMRRPAL
ncbi:threonine/serine exporter family protein [Microbacterium sp. AZCO]|uniref:threonine/serine exporter family protein n=1 Tax=Microbacterium sp. AZCO TaxID=3142976 RepID=UPI0031F35C6F